MTVTNDSVGFKALESMISTNTQTIVGDPIFIGILILIFFMGFVMLQRTRYDTKIMVLVSAFLLASLFIPWLGILLAIGAGAIVFLAFTKFINR